MADDVTILEAATQFTEEEITSEAGRPVARLLQVAPKSPRIPGQDKGKVIISPDFDNPLPENIINDFLNPGIVQL